MGWNYGDILDAIAPVLAPEAPALIHGERVISWGETIRRTNNLARALLAGGAQPGDRIAFYMRNRPEYIEAVAAGFKARLTHVNVNYRYTAAEVRHILEDSDAAVVVHGAEFAPVVAELRGRLPKVKLFVEVADGAPGGFSASFDELANQGDGAPLDIVRSPEDQLFLYTGGTTGMPKGVMWAQTDFREVGLSAARRLGPVPETLPALVEAIRAQGPGPRMLTAPPLMHGTGFLSSINTHMAAGCVITLQHPSFDPVEMLAAIDRHRPQTLVVVGDAFARPLLAALDAAERRYDLSTVALMVSSGVMWSVEIKRGLLRHMPRAVLQDGFSSSEAIGMGSSLMTSDGEVETARFATGERCRVFDEQDRPVLPGSGVAGLVALTAPNPIGYHKDPAKTARTFRVIDGVRYSVPGDWCLVEADGSLTLLGRGSACINTAGEKVFPEEVEEVLKTHGDVDDALVVGTPDPAWGQAVTAVVRLAPGAELDEDAVRRHVRARLAGYKTPKRIVATTETLRAPNGKADYKAAATIALTALGPPT